MYILGDSQPCKCHATLAGFPSCEPTLCFKYCACRVRTACGIMPSMLKRIFFFSCVLLPSKLSWLLASTIKPWFSAVFCRRRAAGRQ